MNILSETDTEQLKHHLRRQAKDPANITFSRHAIERLRERDITVADTLRLLRTGDFCQPIIHNKVRNEYRAKIQGRSRGMLLAVVLVTQADNTGSIYLITAEHVLKGGEHR